MESRMKKGIRIFLSVLFIIILVGAGLLVLRFYPVYQGAKKLEQEMTFDNLSFDATVTFSEERLKDPQNNLISGLSMLTGMPRENLETLTLRGRVYGENVYVQVIPKGSESALTELYFSEEADYINGAMLYKNVKDHLSEQYGILAMLLPDWTGGEFLTFTQAEDMFGITLDGVQEMHLSEFGNLFTFKKSFAMLTAMEQGKTAQGDKTFTIVNETGVTTQSLEITFLSTQQPSIYMQGRSDDLQQTIGTIDNLLAKFRSDKSISWKKGVQNIKSVQAELTVGDAQEIVLPDSVVSQDTADKIATIRSILQELKEKF